jgi:Holliday junction resolvase
MNTSEKRFEDKLIGALRSSGFWANHLNIMNNAGFPDILAIHKNTVALIECKIAPKMEDLIYKSFEPTQLPFYINFIRSGGGNIWLAFEHYGESHLCLISAYMFKEWKTLTWNDILEESCQSWYGPVSGLAESLKVFLEVNHG